MSQHDLKLGRTKFGDPADAGKLMSLEEARELLCEWVATCFICNCSLSLATHSQSSSRASSKLINLPASAGSPNFVLPSFKSCCDIKNHFRVTNISESLNTV